MAIVLPNLGSVAPTDPLPLIDGNDAAAPWNALGSVARGIGQIGAVAGEIGEKIQTAENEADELAVKRQLAEKQAAFERSLLEDHGHKNYRTRLETEVLPSARELITPEMSPAVRDRLGLVIDQWESDMKIGTEAAAAKKAVQRQADELRLLKTASILNDQPETYITAVDASNTLTPEERDLEKLSFRRDVSIGRLRKSVEEDPITAAQILDDPETSKLYGISEADRLGLRAQAEVGSNRVKAEFFDRILNRAMDEGTNSAILSKQELQELAKEGTITHEMRASYLRAYHAGAPPAFSPQLYNEAFGAISTYDPANDPTGATLAQLRGNIATLPLPKESLAELRSRLDDRVKPENPKAHKLAGDFAQLTKESFDGGRFGNWFTFADHDDDPRTIDAKVIDFKSYGRAIATKQRFADAWDGWLRNQGEDIDPVKAQETYDSLFERIVLDNDEPAAAPLIPGAPPVIDFGRDIDRLLGTPAPGTPAPAAGRETSSTGKPATFGGQPIRPPGTFYRGARATVFGGASDPIDNGRSAFGGATGTGGREGVAIPLDVLKATFPGKDKAWFAKNVRAVVKTDDGRQAVLPLADLGTAEWVWQRDGRPVLDLTPGAAKQLGGRPIYRDGKLHGIANLGSLSFALTTDNAGPEADLRGLTWEQAQDAWFRDKKPTTGDAIASGLGALKSAWLEAQAKDIDPDPWGDGTGGTEIPDIGGEGVLPAYPGADGE